MQHVVELTKNQGKGVKGWREAEGKEWYDQDGVETYIASDKVSNSRNNGPELLEPSTLFGSSSMNKNVG